MSVFSKLFVTIYIILLLFCGRGEKLIFSKLPRKVVSDPCLMTLQKLSHVGSILSVLPLGPRSSFKYHPTVQRPLSCVILADLPFCKVTISLFSGNNCPVRFQSPVVNYLLLPCLKMGKDDTGNN